MLRPFLIALQFLTRLPVSVRDPGARDVGRSMLFYPLVGLLLGLVLAGWATMTASAPSSVAAAVGLGFWVIATGALHLDGLADSADAWIGGFGDRQRTLDIMHDPRCGPVAVAVVAVALIMKFAALEALFARHAIAAVAIAPMLGRAAMPLLFLTTPYVRAGGIGSVLAENLPRAAALIIVIIAAIAAGWVNFWTVIAAAVVFAILRAVMVSRIGGTTGDTAGAMLELVETSALVAAALT